jgi:hypothetical protein
MLCTFKEISRKMVLILMTKPCSEAVGNLERTPEFTGSDVQSLIDGRRTTDDERMEAG